MGNLAKISYSKRGLDCRGRFNSFPNTRVKHKIKQNHSVFYVNLQSEHNRNFKNQKSLKWARIAKELNSRKTENSCIRLGKHCRERWMNNLNPELVK